MDLLRSTLLRNALHNSLLQNPRLLQLPNRRA